MIKYLLYPSKLFFEGPTCWIFCLSQTDLSTLFFFVWSLNKDIKLGMWVFEGYACVFENSDNIHPELIDCSLVINDPNFEMLKKFCLQYWQQICCCHLPPEVNKTEIKARCHNLFTTVSIVFWLKSPCWQHPWLSPTHSMGKLLLAVLFWDWFSVLVCLRMVFELNEYCIWSNSLVRIECRFLSRFSSRWKIKRDVQVN